MHRHAGERPAIHRAAVPARNRRRYQLAVNGEQQRLPERLSAQHPRRLIREPVGVVVVKPHRIIGEPRVKAVEIVAEVSHIAARAHGVLYRRIRAVYPHAL